MVVLRRRSGQWRAGQRRGGRTTRARGASEGGPRQNPSIRERCLLPEVIAMARSSADKQGVKVELLTANLFDFTARSANWRRPILRAASSHDQTGRTWRRDAFAAVSRTGF